MAPQIYFPNLNLKFNVGNVAFEVMGIKVYYYGLLIAFSILLGYILLENKLKKRGEKIEDYVNYIITVIFMSIVGARAYYVLFSWDYYSQHKLQIFNLRNGGIAIYGAILAAILTTIVYCRIKKIQFLSFADTLAPYLVLGQAIGRWGNFFNKEAFGGYTDNLVAMAIRSDVAGYMEHVTHVRYFDQDYIQVHPTFLYESIACFLIFALLVNCKQKMDGQVVLSYLFFYSLARFFIEGLRVDQLQVQHYPISQIVAILLMLISSTLYLWERRKAWKKKEETKS